MRTLTGMQLQGLKLRSDVFAAHFSNLFLELLESSFWFRTGHVSSRKGEYAAPGEDFVFYGGDLRCPTALCGHAMACLNRD